MGEAKKRGSYEQRVAVAAEKRRVAREEAFANAKVELRQEREKRKVAVVDAGQARHTPSIRTLAVVMAIAASLGASK